MYTERRLEVTCVWDHSRVTECTPYIENIYFNLRINIIISSPLTIAKIEQYFCINIVEFLI